VIDVINEQPGFDTRMLSNVITDITSTTITLASEFPTRNDGSPLLGTSMWAVEEGFSPVPQVPVEFFQYLAEAVTAYVMESQGDQEGYVRALQRMERMLKNSRNMINPRVDGESKKFVRRSNRGTFSYNSWRY
jgi:hypothetical protein